MKRREFLVTSTTASLSALLLNKLFPALTPFSEDLIQDSSNIILKNASADAVEILKQMTDSGIVKFRVSNFSDNIAKFQVPLHKINSSYGRLSNIDLQKGLSSEEIFIITKGPMGKKFADNYPHLNIISKYSSKLNEYYYLTDASPHYWNNLHRNPNKIYKTYFIDTVSRESVQFYLNIYETNSKFSLSSPELVGFLNSLNQKYKDVEKESLIALKKKYDVTDFNIFLSQATKKLA